MTMPRIGVSLPTFGPHAGPAAVVSVAQATERLGFHSVSAAERLLLPATPGWRNEFGLPESPVFDPIEMLTWAAAHTERIRLGTAVVNPLFQPPIVLARRLATLDQLLGGRLDVGLGQGWLPEEFTAVGVPLSRRGAGFEEHVAALRSCWGPDPVEHDGQWCRIPRSFVGPKPFNGDLPVLIGAGSRVAIQRAARLGAGVIAAVWDWDVTHTELQWYRGAGGAGPVVLRMARRWAGEELRTVIASFVSTALDDLDAAASIGADEVHWDLNLSELDPRQQVDALEAFAAALAR
jgi:probable F420-dependent oxidoreductase